MALTLVIEKLQVEAISDKFGGAIKAGGEWLNFNRGVGIKATELSKGETYEFEISIGQKADGTIKRYVNAVIGLTGAVAMAGEPAVVAAPVKRSAVASTTSSTGGGVGMSKVEWAAKDKRISRQGVIQVAVQVRGTFEEAVELADKMLAFVNE